MFVDEKAAGELKLDEASQLILRAAEYIQKYGWCQEGAYKGSSACMYGALWEPSVRGCAQGPVMRAVEERINEACGVYFMATWNDAPGRTKEEVVAKLREVAYGSR